MYTNASFIFYCLCPNVYLIPLFYLVTPSASLPFCSDADIKKNEPHLLGNKNSVFPTLIAADIYFTKKTTCVQTRLWTFQRTGTDVYSKYGFAALMCGRLFILSCKHWTWLMMMSLKYSVCSVSTKPGLMEIDHRGGSNVGMCLFELSWIYFSFTYLLKSNRKIYIQYK